MLFLLVLLAIGAYVVFHVMNDKERAKLFRTALGAAAQAKDTAGRHLLESDAFRDALRARTRLPIVTYGVAATLVAVFLAMCVTPGSFDDPSTLVAWGGSIGPRTTNGEWWRLLGSTFVSTGFFALLVNVTALVSAGIFVERTVGNIAFGVVYVAAALFTSLVNLSTYPMVVSVGPSGAVFGIYGLLAACAAWSAFERSPFALPLRAAKIVVPPACVFVLYTLQSTAQHGEGELVACIAGLGCGLFLTRGIGEEKPGIIRSAVPAAAAMMTAVAFAVPLRGVADVRPGIARPGQGEARTTQTHQIDVEEFTQRWVAAAPPAGGGGGVGPA